MCYGAYAKYFSDLVNLLDRIFGLWLTFWQGELFGKSPVAKDVTFTIAQCLLVRPVHSKDSSLFITTVPLVLSIPKLHYLFWLTRYKCTVLLNSICLIYSNFRKLTFKKQLLIGKNLHVCTSLLKTRFFFYLAFLINVVTWFPQFLHAFHWKQCLVLVDWPDFIL